MDRVGEGCNRARWLNIERESQSSEPLSSRRAVQGCECSSLRAGGASCVYVSQRGSTQTAARRAFIPRDRYLASEGGAQPQSLLVPIPEALRDSKPMRKGGEKDHDVKDLVGAAEEVEGAWSESLGAALGVPAKGKGQRRSRLASIRVSGPTAQLPRCTCEGTEVSGRWWRRGATPRSHSRPPSASHGKAIPREASAICKRPQVSGGLRYTHETLRLTP